MKVYLEDWVFENPTMFIPALAHGRGKVISPDMEMCHRHVLTKAIIFPSTQDRYIDFFKAGIESYGKKVLNSRGTDKIRRADVRGRERRRLERIAATAARLDGFDFSSVFVYELKIEELKRLKSYREQVRKLLGRYTVLYKELFEAAEPLHLVGLREKDVDYSFLKK